MKPYAKELQMGRRAIYFDLETTGTNVEQDRIVEIAWYDPVYNLSFSSLVNPEQPIPAEATQIHGISNSMVEEQPTLAQLVPRILETLTPEIILIAHNGERFDFPLLGYELLRVGATLPKIAYIDSLKWAKKYRPDLPKHALQFLRKIYDVQEIQTHRALDDVMMLHQVFSQMIDDLDIETVYSLLQQSDETMPFGKYKGRMLCDVPQEYVSWLHEQKVFDKEPSLKKAFEKIGML